jgi:hypothetical protein
MSIIKKVAICLGLFLALSLLSAPAFAVLADLGTPYVSSTEFGPKIWSDTTEFAGEPGHLPDLAGHVVWAVFGPGEFTSPAYTPTPGEFTYVYQVFSTGAASISSFTVPLENDADNPAYFIDAAADVSGNPPIAQLFKTESDPYNVEWRFSGINTGNSSMALAFSSPKTPQDFLGVVVNGGQFGIVDPIPVPSSNSIPEPATFLSLLIGLGLIMATKRIRG